MEIDTHKHIYLSFNLNLHNIENNEKIEMFYMNIESNVFIYSKVSSLEKLSHTTLFFLYDIINNRKLKKKKIAIFTKEK